MIPLHIDTPHQPNDADMEQNSSLGSRYHSFSIALSQAIISCNCN